MLASALLQVTPGLVGAQSTAGTSGLPASEPNRHLSGPEASPGPGIDRPRSGRAEPGAVPAGPKPALPQSATPDPSASPKPRGRGSALLPQRDGLRAQSVTAKQLRNAITAAAPRSVPRQPGRRSLAVRQDVGRQTAHRLGGAAPLAAATHSLSPAVANPPSPMSGSPMLRARGPAVARIGGSASMAHAARIDGSSLRRR